MSDSIAIKILSNEDFDNLGYRDTRGADVSGSLGFADTIKRKVFVRDTGVHQLNKYLVDHEIKNLFQT